MGVPARIHVVDSHTEGEPTRVVIDGVPALRADTMAGRVAELRREHDGVRSGIVREPRGHDAIVGAYMVEPTSAEADFGVIFFNNTQYLGMCGHGTIGVVATLAHLNRLSPGETRVETPVGIVRARLHENGSVTVWNVRSYRHRAGVTLDVPGYGPITGDIAYGGNWFFLVEDDRIELTLSNLEGLTAFTTAIRRALEASGITGADCAQIDHIEIFGRPTREDADSRNFVLCPGLAYDRSPCGTGLSAKLACLAADGKLMPGETWRQESIIGSLFEGAYAMEGEAILPSVTGRAWITAEAQLLFQEGDPYCRGIVA